MIDGSLEVKLPTIWTDEKQSREEAERRERLEERRVEEKRVRRKKMQMREKVGKSRNTVFPMIWGSGGSTSRLAKAAGAEPAGQMRDEKLHAVVARSTFPSQNLQNTSASTFGSCDVEKVHAALTRSTFPSQNVQNASASDHFWKLRCRKKCTPLWREAHFQVKMCKTPHCRTTFGSCDVEKVHAVVARSTFSKSKCTKHLSVGPLLEVHISKKWTPLWREAHFEVKMCKTLGGSDHFWRIHQWIRSAIPDSQQPNLSYRFPIFETSATALCGTTGNIRNNQSMKLEIIDAIKNEWWFQHIPTIKKVWTCWMELNSHEKNG